MTDSRAPFRVDRSSGVLTLTLDRPEHGNALPPSAAPQLTELFSSAQADAAVRCILIRGEGKHFTTGGDVAGFARALSAGVAALQTDFKCRMANVKKLAEAMVGFDRPIVAAVKGGVAGAGLLYSLAADVIIGDETTFFLFAHQRMGLSPDAGVTWLLPRVIGLRPAKALVLTAGRVNAEEAHRLGLISQIVPQDRLDEEALTIAKRFAKAPQHAIRAAKRLLNAALATDLPNQLDAEGAALVDAVGDPDFAEGVMSFVEKRPVKFPSGQ